MSREHFDSETENYRVPALEEIFSPIIEDLQTVEKLWPDWFKTSPPALKKMASQVISSGGKLIRPGVLLLGAAHFGYRGKEKIRAAAMIEAIHTASLIHDDIIDSSLTRRGRKTAVRIFGQNFSLLLGDYLFIKSINNSLIIAEKKIPLMLVRVTEEMIEGEIEELIQSYNFNLTAKKYFQIIQKKTASLFLATCSIAAELGQASKEEAAALSDYGLNLGLTFQIIDDLLDLTGNPKVTGKSRFSDLREGRVTLPVILALKNSPPEIKNQLISRLEKLKFEPEKNNFSELLDLLEKSGALSLTFHQAERLASKARKSLLQLSNSKYRQSLLELVDFVLYRKK